MLKLKLQYFGCLIQRGLLLLLLFSHLSHHSVNPRIAACQASLSFIISWSLFKLKFIELVMPFSQLSLCHPLLLLPSIFPSIRVFSNELTLCIRWPNYWSFNFSIGPSNDYSGLISFRIDWFDLLAVQETLKSLLQYHSSKASVLWRSASFISILNQSAVVTWLFQTMITKREFRGNLLYWFPN